MKLKLDEDSNNPELNQSEARSEIQLPQGLFGFAEIRKMELVYDQEELPFMWLREQKKDGLAFIVLELLVESFQTIHWKSLMRM